MIKIDKEITEMEGSAVLLCTEIATFFNTVNLFFDKYEDLTPMLEEAVVCDEKEFLEIQKVMVRLAKAHDRAVIHKEEMKLKF